MISKPELDQIRNRWRSEKKISADSVEKLLDAADKALTMQAADGLRRPDGGGLGSIIDDLFGPRR